MARVKYVWRAPKDAPEGSQFTHCQNDNAPDGSKPPSESILRRGRSRTKKPVPEVSPAAASKESGGATQLVVDPLRPLVQKPNSPPPSRSPRRKSVQTNNPGPLASHSRKSTQDEYDGPRRRSPNAPSPPPSPVKWNPYFSLPDPPSFRTSNTGSPKRQISSGVQSSTKRLKSGAASGPSEDVVSGGEVHGHRLQKPPFHDGNGKSCDEHMNVGQGSMDWHNDLALRPKTPKIVPLARQPGLGDWNVDRCQTRQGMRGAEKDWDICTTCLSTGLELDPRCLDHHPRGEAFNGIDLRGGIPFIPQL